MRLDGWYGIAFGVAGDWSTFYTLEIYPNGWYGIYRYDPTAIVTLSEASFTSNPIRAARPTRSKSSGLDRPSTPTPMASFWQALTDGTYAGSRDTSG